MKRILNSFMIIAMTAMTLSSCQTKEIETDFKGEEGDIHVIVKANGEVDYSNTKTAAVEGTEGTYVKWLPTDKLDIWETPLGEEATTPKAFTSGVAYNLPENGMQADFSVSFGGTVTGEEFWYTAIYPSGAVTKSSSGFYRYKMPAKQVLSPDGNFSGDCDVMIGEPVHKSERVSNGNTLEYSFRRPGTVVKLRLKGIHSGETINSIKINAPAKITGFTKICIVPNEEYHIGEVYDFAYDEADNLSKYTLEIDGNGFVSGGDDDVWVRFNACTWPKGSSLDITVDTDEAVYTKSYNNNLPKEYKFEEGGLTKFGFSFGVNDREEKSTAIAYSLVKEAKDIVEGATYIFVGRNQSKSAFEGAYYGFGALDGSIISPVQLVKITQSQSDPAPETIMVDNTTVVYTSTFESTGSGKYYMTYNGGYLKSGNKAISKVEKSSATSWSISIDNSIVTIGDGTYVISPNLGAQRFACYSAIQSANFPYLYVDLSTVKAQLAAPSVSAVEQDLATAIKVTCSPVTTDTEGNAIDGVDLVYTLTVTGETEVAPITLSDDDLVEGQYERTVSDLEYGSYVVNVTVTDANDKYRSNYGEKDIELVQPELESIGDLVATGYADDKKIELVWTDVKDADTYTIKNGDSSLGSVAAEVGKYTISDITYGQEYVITVEASKEGYQASISNTQTLTVTQPKVANPQIEVETNASAKTICISWEAVKKATKYEVYNFNDKLAEVGSGVKEYTIKNVEYDVFYEISIKAINVDNANYLPGISNTVQVSINNPEAIGVFEVIADATTPNKLDVAWDEAENATSYTIEYYNGEDLISSASDLNTTEHTFLGVDAGTYTVKVTASAEGFEPRTESSDPVTVRNATIAYATVTGGTISSDPQGSAKVGSVVTLSNTPSTGYEFKADSYTVNSEAIVGNTFEIAGDVTVAGTFQKINYTITKSGDYASNITIKKNDVVVYQANYGDVITIEASSVSGKIFESWDVTGATPTSTTANPTTFTMGTSNVTVTANYKVGAIDVLTNADFVATSTTYKDFSGVKKNTAVYAGNSSKNNGIQLRSKDNSGIVSTTSGGCIKSVTVTWNSNCAAGRVLDVYVKNSAYASAADLYNSTNKGTKLGSITEGSTTTFTITGNYAYVGVRSNDNALNIDEIKFEWGEGDTPTPPTPTTLSAPTGLSSSDVTETSATLKWNTVPNANGYKVKIGSTEYDANTNSYSATGLTEGTQYTWTVKAIGDDVNYTSSGYATDQYFTTTSGGGSTTDTKEFDASDFNGGTSGTGSSVSKTSDSITVSTDKGFATTQFRVYKGGKLTITSSAGNIKKITFTFSGEYTGGLSAENDNVNAKSKEFTLSSQARFSKITVEYYTN